MRVDRVTVDQVAILDWSAASTPRRGADSIWLGLAGTVLAGTPPITSHNLPTRAAAETALLALVRDCLADGKRLLIGADFGFGYPAGFARTLTGQAAALAVWEWLAARIEDDTRNRNNRFAVAAAANRALPGLGPFWFRPAAQGFADLPLKGRARHGHGLAEFRAVERLSPGAQSMWKLGGAGSVGSQALTGLPVLWRLRTAFPGRVGVWPFEPAWRDAPVVLAEVFPSLLADQVAALCTRDDSARPVKDAVQVRLLAGALARLAGSGGLEPLLEAVPDDPLIRAEEGWILGAGPGGAMAALGQAAQAVGTEALPPPEKDA